MILKFTAKLISVITLLSLALCICSIGVGAEGASSGSLISTYTVDFDDDYTSADSSLSVVDSDRGKALQQKISTNAQSFNFEIANASGTPFTLKDGKVYCVSLTYSVVQVGGEDKTAATVLNLVRKNTNGGELVKVKSFTEATYYAGDSTDWVTSTVVFKASIASSADYNRLAVNVVSASCPETSSALDSNYTVILFDGITVTECNENTKSIEFVSNGGSFCETAMAQSGEAITLPTPTRDLHKFEGWYTEPSLTNKFTKNTMPSSLNTRLYAKWSVTDEGVSIKFKTNCEISLDDFVGREGDKVTLPKLERDGFFFSGWYDKSLETKCSLDRVPAEDVTLYAKWESVPRICGFENKEAFPSPNNSSFTMRCVIEQSDKALSGTSFLHYSFQRGVELGQSYNPRGVAGVILYDKNGELITVKDNTKYAVTFSYFVESNTTEGRIAMISASSGGAWYERQSQEEWSVLEYGPEDVGKGWQKHTFIIDWKIKNEKGTAAYIGIAGDGVVYIDDISIYEISNGGSFNAEKATVCFETGYEAIGDTVYAEIGSTLTLPKPEREGYNFLGWTLDEDRLISAGSELTVDSLFTLLYADWYKIPAAAEEPDKPVDSEADLTPSAGGGNGDGGITLYIVIAAVAAVAVIGTAVVLILVKKRKKS